jgi:hypothetical protein
MRRTRTFKTPINFNPTARSSVTENWTFVVTVLRTAIAEWLYIHTLEHCLQNNYDRYNIEGIFSCTAIWTTLSVSYRVYLRN